MKDIEKTKIIDEMFELHLCENKIKEDIIKFNQNCTNSQKYVLINKNWIEKYKQYYNYENFLKTQDINSPPSIIENIFIIDYLFPEFDYRPLESKNEEKNNMNFSLPKNFVLVSENFIKLIMENFGKNNSKENIEKEIFENLTYEVIIGGKCIIISDKYNKLSYFIAILKESDNKNKDNCYYDYNIDSINFIIKFEDDSKIEKELNDILSYGISKYIAKRNLGSQYFQKILNSENELIGYFYNILFYYDLRATNLGLYFFGPKPKLNNILKNESIFDSKTYAIKSKKSKEIKEIIDPHINSFLICLYQIEKLKKKFENIDNNEYIKVTIAFYEFFKNFGRNPSQSVNIFQNEMLNKIKFDNYQNLVQTLIAKVNSELNQNIKNDKTELETTKQYDENEAKKKFKEKNKNSSFIQELFYSIKETISSCSECNMSTYIFEYIPFVLIEDEEETIIKLSEKLFNSKTEEKNSKCHFCGGTIKKCKIEIKINEFSNILIILVNDKVKNFQTETLFYNKNQGISYILFCFIEKDTNDVYTFKNNIWYKYNENYQLEKAKN